MHLFVFEGPHGSGKSMTARRLAEHLTVDSQLVGGRDVVVFEHAVPEPEVRESPWARALHYARLREALVRERGRSNAVVLAVRWVDSTVIVGRELDEAAERAAVLQLARAERLVLPKPLRTFHMDAPDGLLAARRYMVARTPRPGERVAYNERAAAEGWFPCWTMFDGERTPDALTRTLAAEVCAALTEEARR